VLRLPQMKKSGIEPTSRTYTTLVNAYAGVNHAQDISRFTPLQPLESKILQRITTIYNQSQTHISECVEALEQQRRSNSDLGIRGDQDLVEEEEDAEGNTDEEEISLGPMNAYLKFLCKYGRWDDMERIYLAMDTEGPLAPDNITYSLMFSALLSRQQQQKVEFASPITAPKPGEARSPTPKPVDVGSTARPMWERAVRQIHPINRELRLGARQIDTELALLAMQCLLAGQTPDQRLAIALIPFLWDLPTPGSTVVASSTPRSEREIPRSNAKEVPPYMLSLPRLAIDSRAAKTILSMLNRANQATLAAHYAEHLLNTPDLRRHIDWGVLQTCIHALSNTGNIDSILHILDTYQPTTGVDGWPRHIWTNALTAARWSTKFPAALQIFRRMTHLSPGFEHGSPTKFTWTPPNRQPVDIQGRRWIPPRPLQPDAKSMSLLLKTAMSRDNLREIRQAWTVLCHYPLNSFFLIPRNELRDRGLTRDISLLPPFNDELSVPMSKSLMIALEWRLILARDVETVAERILDALMSREEVRTVDEIRKVMGEVARVWGGRMGVHRGGSRVQVSEDEEEDGQELGRNRAVG